MNNTPATDCLPLPSGVQCRDLGDGRIAYQFPAAYHESVRALLKNAAEHCLKPQVEPEPLDRFITFMRLCFDNRDLKTQFDRLRGTNVSRRGSPMSVMIDDATGKFEADARAFFDFCLDLYQRLPAAQHEPK